VISPHQVYIINHELYKFVCVSVNKMADRISDLVPKIEIPGIKMTQYSAIEMQSQNIMLDGHSRFIAIPGGRLLMVLEKQGV